ncbi:MAG: FHA domain-containing protein [Nitrosomonadales bacterium]|nr:FHA domain-containing protein [Nitrosomonadales bacterium]
MSAKLILSMDGAVIKEYPLNKERMTIGRKPHNDIAIDNLAVSGEHAAIVTILHDSFLEDLDSTNGLEVNGVPTKKHFLQNNDVIEIGKYKLKYINDQVTQTTAADFEKTMVMRSPVKQAAPGMSKPAEIVAPSQQARVIEKTGKFEAHPAAVASPAAAPVAQPVAQPLKPATAAAPESVQHVAVVQVLTGPNAGKELELVKNLTTLGKPGFQVAVLTRRPHGFFITHVEGEHFPLVNGETLTNQAHQLNDHDVIELAGVKMEFYYKK